MSGASTADDRVSTWILVVGIVLVSLNLRPAIVSVAPLLDVIGRSLELTSAEVSLLTAVPVVLIGVFALSVPLVVSKLGYGRGVFLGVVFIGVGTAARVGGEYLPILFVSTLVVGIGIGITQALLPSIVKLYFPGRVAFGTGLYTVSLTVGAALASGVTAPIERALGSWSGALAIWAVVAGAALIAWLPIRRKQFRERPQSQERPQSGERPQSRERSQSRNPTTTVRSTTWALCRNPLVVVLTLFFIFNTSVYYSMLTWLPPRFVALGWSETAAGLLLTVFIVAGLAGMLMITIVGDRTRDRRVWLVPTIALTFVGTAGLTVVPEGAPWIWASTLGFGVGAWFTLMLMLPVDYAIDSETTGRLSAIAIAGGYVFGGVAPFVVGLLRDLFGGFSIPFGGLVVFSLLALVMSLVFSPHRERSIG